MDFEPPPIPRRQRPQRPSYAPVTRELLLDGGFKDRPGLPIAEPDPGAIVRSPSGAIMPQPTGAIVPQPRGLAVHQRYSVYATPGFISSEPETKTQPASKARFRLRKRPKLKLPNLPKLRLSNWKLPTPATTTTASRSEPKSQSGKPSEKLASLKLPKPALSGAGFGSIRLGKSGNLGGQGGSDSFGDDPIAQLFVKVFLVLLILIPLIL